MSAHRWMCRAPLQKRRERKPMAEPILRLEGLCKDYGEGLVLSGLSLDDVSVNF